MCESVQMERSSSEFLRAIRGSRSQLALARRLGYRSNPVANWESGRRFPTAREALRACRRVRIDVAGAFARFLPAASAGRDVERDLPGWLRDVKGKAAIGSVAERSGLSRFAVSRFLRGSAEPRLPDFLRLVEGMTGRASDLVAELVPIDQVPSLATGHKLRQAARELAFEEPWTEAILRALECAEGRARATPSWIAVELGLSRADVQRCLDKLLAAQLVQMAGGAYRAIGSLTVDTKAAPARTYALNAHWAGVALARIPEPRADDLFAYNVFSVAEADLERIAGVLRASFREIRAIIASSQHDETVALMNLQLVRLAGC